MSGDSPKRTLKDRRVLPNPVKIMACLGAAFILIGALTGVVIVESLRQFGREIVDPAVVARVAKEVGFENLDKSANALWQPYLGISLKERGAIVMLEQAQMQECAIVARLNDGKDEDFVDEGKFLEQLSNFVLCGTRTAPSFNSFQSIKEKGKLYFDGTVVSDGKPNTDLKEKEKEPYVRFLEGTMVDESKQQYVGMIGLYRSGKKLFIVEASVPADKPFDKGAVLALLKEAESAK